MAEREDCFATRRFVVARRELRVPDMTTGVCVGAIPAGIGEGVRRSHRVAAGLRSVALIGGNREAAEACFGTASWPDDVAVPQVSLEFELADAQAVAHGAAELRSQGHQLLHDPKTEPWGQTVARLLSPKGAIVGLSYAPSLHEELPRD